MNQKLLTFLIHEHAKIRIQQPAKNYTFDWYDEANFIMQYYQHQYILERTHVKSAIEAFKEYLNNTLQNNHQLNSYLTDNIGYYWNYALNQKYKHDQIFGDDYDILNNFNIWSRYNQSTFLYNDHQGNVIFEITPLYPYTYAYGKKKRTYGYFLKWMQSYKPTFKSVISKETVLKWIEQTQEILDIIDENSKKLYIESEI